MNYLALRIREFIVFYTLLSSFFALKLNALDNVFDKFLEQDLTSLSKHEQRTASYNLIRHALEAKFAKVNLDKSLKLKALKKARLTLLAIKDERLSADYLAIALSFYANNFLYEFEDISHFMALYKANNEELVPKNLALSTDYTLFLKLCEFLKSLNKNENFLSLLVKSLNKDNNNIIFLASQIKDNEYIIGFNEKNYILKHENFIPSNDLRQENNQIQGFDVILLKEECKLMPKEKRDLSLGLFDEKECFVLIKN